MYHKYEPNRSYAVKQECEEVVDSYSFKLVECKSDRPNVQEGEGLSGGGGGGLRSKERVKSGMDNFFVEYPSVYHRGESFL